MANRDREKIARRIDALDRKATAQESPDLSKLAANLDQIYREPIPEPEQITPVIPAGVGPASEDPSPSQSFPSGGPKQWQKIITFERATQNSGINSADIPDHHFKTLRGVTVENGVCESAPEPSLLNESALGSEGHRQIDGLHRSFNKAGDKKLIVACDQQIYYWTGSAFSSVKSSLTREVPYSFLNHNDKTLICNGYDDPLEFDPATNGCAKSGLEPLRFYKKIAYFESDETVTQVTATATTDTSVYRIDERTGKSRTAMKLVAYGGGVSPLGYVVPVSVSHSTFPNGGSIADDDLLNIHVFHVTRAYVSSVLVRAWTDATHYSDLTIDISELDPRDLRNNQWTKVRAKRSRFVTGAGGNAVTWTAVNRWYFGFTSVTGGTTVYIDNVHWTNAPIEATAYQKTIETFDTAKSSWTATDASHLTDNTDYRYIKRGNKSLKWTHSATESIAKNLSIALDLSQYIDGITSETSDEICLWVYCTNTTNLTNINLYLFNLTNESKGYYYAYTGFSATSTGGWIEIRVKKSAFSNVGTPTGWNSIMRIRLDFTVTGATTLYLDDWRMEEAHLIKEIANCEQGAESWTFSPSTDGGFNTEQKFVHKGLTSIYMKVPKKSSSTVSLAISPDIDLTLFAAGEASGNDDLICFYMAWTVFSTIKSVTLKIDVNTGDFATDYYKYEVTPEYLMNLLNLQGVKSGKTKNLYANVEVKKSDFARIGSTGGQDWADACGIQFVIQTADKGLQTTLYFDHIHMRRATGLAGLYQFCAVSFAPDPAVPGGYVYGAPSEWSNQITLSGTKALLRLIPVSQDTNIGGRLIFRKGGSAGPTARLDTTLWDNATTDLQIETDDALLGELLTLEKYPKGTIRVPVFGKLVDKPFKGRVMGFRDPLNLRKLYYSNIGYHYAWSESQAIEFSTDLLDVWIKDDILIANTSGGIRIINDDLGNVGNSGIQETGLSKPCMTPFGSTPIEEVRGFAGYDGYYLYTGIQFNRISDPAKNYFNGNSYDLDAIRGIYANKHLYLSVSTTGGTRSLLDCYIPSGAWRTATDISPLSFCLFDGAGDIQEVYYGDASGYVYRLDNPSAYSDTVVVETKDFHADIPFADLIARGVDIIAKSASSAPGHINMKFRIGQTQNDSIILTFPDYSAKAFTGSGLNDLTLGGAYSGTAPTRYAVKISTAAGTDKFQVSTDGGETWGAEISITGAAQNLGSGVTGTFGATTGHTLDDRWDFTESNLSTVYTLHRAPISGIEDIVKGLFIGGVFYPGTAGKQIVIQAIRMYGDIAPLHREYEET